VRAVSCRVGRVAQSWSEFAEERKKKEMSEREDGWRLERLKQRDKRVGGGVGVGVALRSGAAQT
jgi:hypothetical protein